MPKINDTETTHFGYQQVKTSDKQEKVAAVFDSVADRYDLMNDLMSFGLHRLWKRFTLDICHALPGQSILDIAGGTGDLTRALAKRVGPAGRVIFTDINASMLNVGRDRMLNEGLLKPIHYTLANAEQLPFANNSFDCVVIGFGLRNVTHIDKALRSMFDVVKPGGRLVILEFSKPVISALQPLYDAYSFHVLPRLGQWITNDAASYQYLAESIRMHPDQATLKQKIIAACFEQCDYFNLSAGIVAVHRAFKF